MNAPTDSVRLRLDGARNARQVALYCVLAELLLVGLDWFVYYQPGADAGGIRSLLNLAGEDSLGTWFSSTQTLAVAVVLWLIRLRVKLSQAANGRIVAGWTLLAAFFAFMAIDDALALHEQLGSAFENFYTDLDDDALGPLGAWFEAYPSYAWQFVLGPVFAAMAVFLLVFLWRQLARPGLRVLLLLALGCLALAVGMDYVEGLYGGYKTVITATGWTYDTVLHLARVLEEFIEMLGTTLFLTAFLYYLGPVTGTFEPARRA